MSTGERRSWMEHLRSAEGKGTAGCLLFALLFGVALFVGINVGPHYLAAKSFEADLKTEVSRAGARFWDNETVMNSVYEMAKKNEVRISQENVEISRMGGQLFVRVFYAVPIDLGLTEYVMRVNIKATSFIGTL